MILTLVLSAVAAVVIFVEFSGWSPANTLHAYLGAVTTALCFIQALIGFSRSVLKHLNSINFNADECFQK